MAETHIEWTDSTWNPVAGCSIGAVTLTRGSREESAQPLLITQRWLPRSTRGRLRLERDEALIGGSDVVGR